jgi:hypothetical protein
MILDLPMSGSKAEAGFIVENAKASGRRFELGSSLDSSSRQVGITNI